MTRPATQMLFHDSPAIVRQELLLQSKHVSGLTIWKFDMHVGPALLRMGGVGGVHTDSAHRFKGYAARVMSECIGWLREHDYDVSLLFGISDFYHRWHYAPCMAGSAVKVETRRAEEAKPLYPVRPALPADLPVIRRIYNRDNASRTGAVERPARLWKDFRKGSTWGTKVLPFVVTRRRRVVAYFVIDDKPNECIACEVASLRPDVFPTIVNTLAAQAVLRRCEHVRLCLPTDHPFFEHLALYGMEATQTYPRAGAAMLAIVNQPSTFRKLLPVLTARLRASSFSGFTGRLAVVTGLAPTVLSIRSGEVSLSGRPGKLAGSLRCPQERLVQLLMGYRSLSAVLNDPDVRLTGNARPLFDLLFPRAFPFIWPADHF